MEEIKKKNINIKIKKINKFLNNIKRCYSYKLYKIREKDSQFQYDLKGVTEGGYIIFIRSFYNIDEVMNYVQGVTDGINATLEGSMVL